MIIPQAGLSLVPPLLTRSPTILESRILCRWTKPSLGQEDSNPRPLDSNHHWLSWVPSLHFLRPPSDSTYNWTFQVGSTLGDLDVAASKRIWLYPNLSQGLYVLKE